MATYVMNYATNWLGDAVVHTINPGVWAWDFPAAANGQLWPRPVNLLTGSA